jgi:5-formyltetrahydrofolate cyclo-ligase
MMRMKKGLATKAELRRSSRKALRALDPELRRRAQAEILRRASELPGFARARIVLLYAAAFPEEVPTRGLLELCLNRGQTLVLPRVDLVGKRLHLHEVRELDRDLQAGCMNIPEPTLETPVVSPDHIDWAWVPGLAFDARGFRLGRGGGFYDRLLAELPDRAPRWSLALSQQCVERLPVEPHDLPVDAIVTPEGVIRTLHETRPFS